MFQSAERRLHSEVWIAPNECPRGANGLLGEIYLFLGPSQEYVPSDSQQVIHDYRKGPNFPRSRNGSKNFSQETQNFLTKNFFSKPEFFSYPRIFFWGSDQNVTAKSTYIHLQKQFPADSKSPDQKYFQTNDIKKSGVLKFPRFQNRTL